MGDIENESFQSSILYWVGILENEANLQFVREIDGGKADVQIWRTLSVLSECDGITINELAWHTRIERTALSHLLTQMEKQKLLERRTTPADRRTIQVFVCDKGREIFNAMLPVRRMVFRRATDGISNDELQIMLSVTRRLIENLRAHSGNSASAP